MNDWMYFDLEGVPARVRMEGSSPRAAEIYRSGTGFVALPPLAVVDEGRVITKSEFDAMLLKKVSGNRPA